MQPQAYELRIQKALSPLRRLNCLQFSAGEELFSGFFLSLCLILPGIHNLYPPLFMKLDHLISILRSTPQPPEDGLSSLFVPPPKGGLSSLDYNYLLDGFDDINSPKFDIDLKT